MQPQSRVEGNEFRQSVRSFDALVSLLSSEDAFRMTHSQLEGLLKSDGRELLRRLLQDHLDYRGLGYAAGPVIGADGVLRSHARPGGRNLATIVGRVRVTRMGYGHRGVDTLYPMDAALNLPASLYSHGLAREFAIEASKTSYGAAVETVQRFTGVVVGMRQAEELVLGAAQDFDPFYRSRSALSESTLEAAGPIGVISVDQKGVVMLTTDLRELTRKAAQAREHKKKKRISKGEKRNAKRMGTVAAVYTIQRHRRIPRDIVRSLNASEDATKKRARPRPENKRLWATLEKEMEDVIKDAFQEVQRRDPHLKKEWVGLVDGNATQILLLEKHAKRVGVKLTIILDIIHVIEYLWKAACVFHGRIPEKVELSG